MRLARIRFVPLALASFVVAGTPALCLGQQAAAEAPQASSPLNEEDLKRITYDIEYMSSDEMGGRQPGTPGIQMCEDYIVEQYKQAGLKPLANGTYLQELEVRGSRTLDTEKTSLTLMGPGGIEMPLELGKDYQTLMGRQGFDLSGDLVFVGYGISAEEHNYDEYADLDVEGKIVVMLRMEPQNDQENSVFAGTEPSNHASGRAKVAAARRAKAAAILMVNDSGTAPSDEQDELMAADRFGTTLMPYIQLKRSRLDEMLAKSPLTAPNGDKLESIKDIEVLIDKNLEPISQPIKGWSAKTTADFRQEMIKTNNIIGIVEGEGPHADETIVIGGHYDHLGLGAYGSRAPGRREIHNGADDNATGTAAVIELGRRFAQAEKKPGRRLVFICFTAEEMGLLGARHYVDNPSFPLENTVAMINFDMIGWLRENKLTLYGWNSSPDFDAVFEAANEGIGFDLFKPERGFGGSDHLPFNGKGIPNTFIHTGTTPVYHTPEDDFEAIDCEGALKVINYSENVVRGLANLEKRPTFGKPEAFSLGVMLDDENDVVTVEKVTEGSAAAVAGIQQGDIILAVGDEAMTRRREVTRLVRRDAGKTVAFKVKRGEKELTIEVVLKKPE